ncbi:hypothetical protein [Rhodococcus pyridinivorans]|uniref:hypothetical protein n=1 Tax=Rhodococcus pyridinivorans TaxID=103816 RepID=UPI00158676F8|nr:hypothetical protein [Rhodococcus pyridinivorans]
MDKATTSTRIAQAEKIAQTLLADGESSRHEEQATAFAASLGVGVIAPDHTTIPRFLSN